MNLYDLHTNKKELLGGNLNTDKIFVISKINNLHESRDRFDINTIIDIIQDYDMNNDKDIENAILQMGRNADKNARELYLIIQYCRYIKQGAWDEAQQILAGTKYEQYYLDLVRDEL